MVVEQFARTFEQTEVIQRTPAAQTVLRQHDVPTQLRQHIGRGLRDLGREVIVERIDPQDDFLHVARERASSAVCGERRAICRYVCVANFGNSRACATPATHLPN